MWKLLDDVEDKDTVLLPTDEHINFSARGELWLPCWTSMVGKKLEAMGGVPVRRKISDTTEAEKPTANNRYTAALFETIVKMSPSYIDNDGETVGSLTKERLDAALKASRHCA